jgi:hypothetical protein
LFSVFSFLIGCFSADYAEKSLVGDANGGCMSWFWKSFLCLFCSCCFCSARADLDFFSRRCHSDKEYAKNIEVKAYFVTKDQVAKAFSEENAEIVQKSNKELYNEVVFLLVRCKNFGDHSSYGTINCRISHREDPISANQESSNEVEVMQMPDHMKSFYNSVHPLGGGTIPNDDKVSVVRCEWKNLYTMKN